MNNDHLLLCDPSEFPYDNETLTKLLDREQTIRTQFKLDLQEAGNRAKEDGRYSQHKPCRYLASEVVPIIIAGVQAVVNKLEVNAATRDKQNIKLLASQPWKTFCAIAFTTILDSTIQRDTLATTITKVGKYCEIETKLNHYKNMEPYYFNRIIEQQHKMGKHVDHIATAMTYAMNRSAEGKYGEPKPDLRWEGWKENYKRWLGNLLIDIIVSRTGLFEIASDKISASQLKRGKKGYARLQPTNTLLEYIEQAENRIGLIGGFYLPLPVPPRDWTTPQNGGFWTVYGGQKKLIKNFSRGYQEEILNEVEQLSRTVMPSINAAQHTAWRINERVYDTLQTLWRIGAIVADLPDRNPLPMPPCPECGQIPQPDHKCFKKNKDALTAWKMKAAAVHRENIRLKSLRLSVSYGLQIAELLRSDDRFYYIYQTDFRGRLYPCAQLHPQGSDWQKGLLEFADGVELGEHGAKWLAVHLANCYGNDKISFEARHQWVLDNEDWILECAENPLDALAWAEADSPFCFLAACFEWAQYKREGNSFKSRLAVALDGSCSGIQHYSAMLRDEIGALATNVKMLPGATQKEDIYQRVADATNNLLQKDVASGETGEWAVLLLSHNMIDRKVVKRAVMTLPYGSTYSSCLEYVGEEVYPKLLEAGADEKSISKIIRYTASKVWEAIPQVVQKAREGMDYLQRLARQVGKQALPVTWTTPTGFPVQQSYYEQIGERISLATGGHIVLKNNVPIWQTEGEQIQVTFATSEKHINLNRQISGIAPNFIHSLDSSHLMMSVLAAKEQGITDFALIHDSLGTHAGNTEQFAQIIRECFYRLYAENDPLEMITNHLVSQIPAEARKKLPEMPTKGVLDVNDILNAQYLFA